MKNIMLVLLTFIISQISFAGETRTYIRANYGIGKFSSEKLDQYNAEPSGATYDVGFGARMSHVELGLFYKNFGYTADIIHDGVANEIKHDGKSFGVDLNVFLNRHFSIKLGYAFNQYDQKVGTSVSASTLTAIKTTYGLEDSRSSSGILYGVGLNVFGSKRFDLTTSIVRFSMGNGKSNTSAQAGIVLYMDASLADFFGSN